MKPFTVHTLESAPRASKTLLESSQKDWGFIPTLHGVLAESAPTLEAYQQLFRLSTQSSMSPAEQQLVYLTVSVMHGCEYCAAGHTYLARMSKLDEDVIRAVREEKPVSDARLQTLRTFTEAVVRERGFVGDAAVDKFIAAGYTRANVLEVLLIIACKTISNYVNHIAHTPLESFMSDPALNWKARRPAGRVA